MSDSEERVIIPEVVGREEQPGPDPDEGSRPVTGATRIFMILLAIACGAWIIWTPDPTDLFFPFGFIDDGIAAFVLLWALERLGVHIPILSRFLGRRASRTGTRKKTSSKPNSGR